MAHHFSTSFSNTTWICPYSYQKLKVIQGNIPHGGQKCQNFGKGRKIFLLKKKEGSPDFKR